MDPLYPVILHYDHPLKSKKVIKYPGYNELAYLHPKRFSPDISVLKELSIKENEPYVIIRFVSWQASHDVGHKGIRFENKIKAVKAFSEYARVFISSESPLPEELQPYRFSLPPHRMHDAIAFASLLFGESSTMSEEAAMLGVPSVYLFNNSTVYTQHLEQAYGLMFNYSESEADQQKAIDKGVELLRQENLHEEWQKRRAKMLADKIDVTAFLVWLVEKWPESLIKLKKDKGYEYNFR
jgi:predicted glycosyltransferase